MPHGVLASLLKPREHVRANHAARRRALSATRRSSGAALVLLVPRTLWGARTHYRRDDTPVDAGLQHELRRLASTDRPHPSVDTWVRAQPQTLSDPRSVISPVDLIHLHLSIDPLLSAARRLTAPDEASSKIQTRKAPRCVVDSLRPIGRRVIKSPRPFDVGPRVHPRETMDLG